MQRLVYTPAIYTKPVTVAGNEITENTPGIESHNSFLESVQASYNGAIILSQNEVKTDFYKYPINIGIKGINADLFFIDQKTHDGEGGEFLYFHNFPWSLDIKATSVILTNDTHFNAATEGIFEEHNYLAYSSQNGTAYYYEVYSPECHGGVAAFYDDQYVIKGTFGNRKYYCAKVILSVNPVRYHFASGSSYGGSVSVDYMPSFTIEMIFNAYLAKFQIIPKSFSNFGIEVSCPVGIPYLACDIVSHWPQALGAPFRFGTVTVYRDYFADYA